MSLRADYDEPAVGQVAAFLDDPPGIRAVLDAIDRLADEPPPSRVVPLWVARPAMSAGGRYRILYEITDDTIAIRHIARGTGN